MQPMAHMSAGVSMTARSRIVAYYPLRLLSRTPTPARCSPVQRSSTHRQQPYNALRPESTLGSYTK